MIDEEIKSAQAWRSDLFPAIKFYHSPKEKTGCSPHFHLDYDFNLINSGAINYKINNRKQPLLGQQVLLMNPSQVHSGMPIEGATLSISNIRIDPDFVWEILDKLEVTAVQVLLVSVKAFCFSVLVTKLYQSLMASGTDSCSFEGLMKV